MDSNGYIQMFMNSGEPDIQDILQLLAKTNSTPNVQVKNLGGNTYGAFNNLTNTLMLSPQGGNTNTVSHELTHALNYQMNNRALDLQDQSKDLRNPALSSADQQFLDAYQKLRPFQSKLIPNDNSDYGKYRYSPTEVQAFGVGNSVDQGPGVEPRAHLDATMAQEAAILRDLYSRSLAKPQQTTPSWIDTLLGMMKRP